MNFKLITASGIEFDQDVYEVLVPTRGGVIALYKDHMPLISAGAAGVLSIRRKQGDADKDMDHFAVYGGIIQVDGKTARFVTDDVTTPDEVSLTAAQAALERAQELVRNAGSRTALHEASNVLHHHEARLHLAQIKTRHHR